MVENITLDELIFDNNMVLQKDDQQLYINNKQVLIDQSDELSMMQPFMITDDNDIRMATNFTCNQAYSHAFNVLSDIRHKIDINDIMEVNIQKIRPVTYKYKTDKSNRYHYGVIAQEIEEIYPQLVYEKSNIKYVDYMQMIPLLIKKINELEMMMNSFVIKNQDL
jgi:hypothetical protein